VGSAPAPAATPDAGDPPLPREVEHSSIKLDLPIVPAFDPPDSSGDVTSIRELRVNAHKHLGATVKVVGYVTWVYDCVDDVMGPGEDRAAAQKRVDADQTLCMRPQLRLGESTRPAGADDLWVVEVPRPPTAQERKYMSKEELAAWPTVPQFALGDRVAITGTWALKSPKNFASSTGLLVYGSLEKAAP
jgi:hypothetical protein